MGRVERDREVARRRARRVKLKKFRARYARATSRAEKDAIMEKARKLSPFIDFESDEKAKAQPA